MGAAAGKKLARNRPKVPEPPTGLRSSLTTSRSSGRVPSLPRLSQDVSTAAASTVPPFPAAERPETIPINSRAVGMALLG
jgi:hypothetical protein